MLERKKNKGVIDEIKAIQYTKKLVSIITVFTLMLSCFGIYINYKNGYSLDAIALKWIDFAIWICGIYLAKAFAETYAQEKNNLQKFIVENQGHYSEEHQSEDLIDNETHYEEVEI